MRRFRTRRDDVAGYVQGGCKAPATRLEHIEGMDSPIDYAETAGLLMWMRLPQVDGSVKIRDFLEFIIFLIDGGETLK